MGTRCLTAIKEAAKDSNNICVIYRQFDGYLDGHGKALKESLNGYRVVNGFNPRQKSIANGMNDLAAQLIYSLKHSQVDRKSPLGDDYNNLVGGIYVYGPDTELDEYYVYTLYCDPTPTDNEDETNLTDEEWQQRMAAERTGQKLNLEVKVGKKVVFDGCIDDFDPGMDTSEEE